MLLLILREDDSSNRITHYNNIFLGFQQNTEDYFSDFSNYTNICI